MPHTKFGPDPLKTVAVHKEQQTNTHTHTHITVTYTTQEVAVGEQPGSEQILMSIIYFSSMPLDNDRRTLPGAPSLEAIGSYDVRNSASNLFPHAVVA